ncbi:hypothetical protein PACTADRAFT_52100 [Pachysolen tannophilus NRRL Y-2460]|uniref:HDA1 complex subunit 3 n=1 Tax=Pachysolen tannophilus NRRL Y-2460 TaxID=669874 RepID=A0A1E4TP50_PACTA|nr:hypothetical protein PACTADRAFT_52100 [Pachysolen tannophilus NRRL Y-2460]
MNLAKILDSTPEPAIIDSSNFKIDHQYSVSGDYKLLTPLTDFQKELFDQIVSLHYSDILKFYERYMKNENNDIQDQLIIDSLKTLLDNSLLVSNHPYLLIDHFFPKNLTSKDMYKTIAETSGKFGVLHDILNIIEKLYCENVTDNNGTTTNGNKKEKQNVNNNAGNGFTRKEDKDKILLAENFNLVIVSSSGKCMDLIESLLLGHKCNIKRYSGDRVITSNKSKKQADQAQQAYQLTVHLLPSLEVELNKEMYNQELLNNDKRVIDLFIVFDISVSTMDNFISVLLNGNNNNNLPKKPQILRLVPSNTIEHIALYFRKNFNDKRDVAYLKPVTAAIVCMRDSIGVIPSELKSVYSTNLKYLVEWFKHLAPQSLIDNDKMNKNFKKIEESGLFPWPLPDLRPIKSFTPNDVEKSLLTEVKFNFNNNDDNVLQLPNHHIVKKRKWLSYYQLKRINNDYVSNPVKSSNQSLMTGIHRTSKQQNYLDNVLTHKLIQNFNMYLLEFNGINKELETFDYIHDIRIEDIKESKESKYKINKDLNDLKEKLNKIDNDNNLKQEKIENFKNFFKKLETEVEELIIKLNSLNENGNDSNKNLIKYTQNQLKLIKLKEDYELELVKLQNKEQENKYMSQELTNALKSIDEFDKEINKLELENYQLNDKVKNLNQFQEIETEKNSAEFLKNKQFKLNEIKNLENLNEDLLRILEINLQKLSLIPTAQRLKMNGVNTNIITGNRPRQGQPSR